MSANKNQPAFDGRKAYSVLIVSTLAFTVCFMAWMMFGVMGIPIKKALNLNATEFGLLTAQSRSVEPTSDLKREWRT